MRVLVTGGAGYIGSVLVPALLGRGHTVRVVDRLFWGRPCFADEPGVEIINADVRRMPEAVFDGVDAIDHLAGFSNDPTSEYSPRANWEMNATATSTLVGLACAAGTRRFILGSSCSLYDGAEGDGLLDESTPVSPRGAYATSKRYSEEVLLRNAGGALEPVILRQATVFGRSPRMRFDLVVNTFVKEALVRKRLVLHGGGRVWRPLVSVEDVARAHIACLEAPADQVAGEVFNVVQGNHLVSELATAVAATLDTLGRHVELVDGPLPNIVRNYRCCGARLRERLGLEFCDTPAAAVADLVAHYGQAQPEELLHPRFYNIAWMELLAAVRPAFHAMDNIFEPLNEDSEPGGAS